MAQIWKQNSGENKMLELRVTPIQIQTRGVSHCGLAIYIKKAKEELWKLKYYITMQKHNLQKKSLKENQNPSRYIS
jgi:hypothetical protein